MDKTKIFQKHNLYLSPEKDGITCLKPISLCYAVLSALKNIYELRPSTYVLGWHMSSLQDSMKKFGWRGSPDPRLTRNPDSKSGNKAGGDPEIPFN